MSQARTILRNTAVLAAARMIERGGNLVLALLVSRQLGAGGLGMYATAIAYYGFVATAAESGTTNLLVREIAKERAQTNAYLVHSCVMAGSVALLVTGVAWVVVPHLGYSNDLTRSLELIALALLPGTLNTIQEAVFVAHQRVEFETLATLGATLATIGASAYLLAEGHGVVSLVLAFVVARYAVTIVYFGLITRFIARVRLRLSRSFSRRLLREIRPFAGSSLLAATFARPEIIFLSFVATEVQVGFYSAAIKVADVWAFIPSTTMINVFPFLSRAVHTGDPRAQALQDQAIKYLLALGLPISVGLAVAARPIVHAFYGDGFGESVLLLRIMAANVAIYCLQSVLWRVLAARGRQDAVFRAQLVTVVVRLAGGYALIAWIAATGAAVATVGAFALNTALLALQLRRIGVPVRILRSAWRFALATIAMGGVLALLLGAVQFWLLVLLGMLVYVTGIVLFRAFSREDVALFRRLFPFRLAERGA